MAEASSESSRQQRLSPVLIWGRRAIFAMFVLIGVGTIDYYCMQRANPVGRVTTLSDYLKWKPETQDFSSTLINGQWHVIAYGTRCHCLLLSSGPPAYVFDREGNLVEWSFDIGDAPEFDKTWKAQGARAEQYRINRSQAESLALGPQAR